MFSVPPRKDIAVIEPRIASGIDVAIITVERQLPRNRRIIRLVSAAAITPSRTTLLIAPVTKTDWSPIGATVSAAGKIALSCAIFALTPWMIASVEVAPLFSTISRTERPPFTCTILV